MCHSHLWLLPAAVGFALTQPGSATQSPAGTSSTSLSPPGSQAWSQLPISTEAGPLGPAHHTAVANPPVKPPDVSWSKLFHHRQSARLTPLLKCAQPQPSFWMSTLPAKVAPPCCEPLPGDCGRLHCPWVLASISFSSPPRSVFHSQRVLVVTEAVKLQLFVPSCSKLCVTVAPNSLPFAIDKDSVATCLSRSKRWGVFNSILCIHSTVGPKVTQGQINFKT